MHKSASPFRLCLHLLLVFSFLLPSSFGLAAPAENTPTSTSPAELEPATPSLRR